MNNLEGRYEERLRKRMQLVLLGWCTPCGNKDNWGWLKFSVVPTQNFTLEYSIASGYFADLFSSCCVVSHCWRFGILYINSLRPSICLWRRFWGVGEGTGRWSNGRPVSNGKPFSFSNQLLHFSLDTICLHVQRERESELAQDLSHRGLHSSRLQRSKRW
jgi:hypothetical protein